MPRKVCPAKVLIITGMRLEMSQLKIGWLAAPPQSFSRRLQSYSLRRSFVTSEKVVPCILQIKEARSNNLILCPVRLCTGRGRQVIATARSADMCLGLVVPSEVS